jgi:hypothetical protein
METDHEYTGKIVTYKSYMESLQILYRIPMQILYKMGNLELERTSYIGFVSGKILSKTFSQFFYNICRCRCVQYLTLCVNDVLK